jgi:YYY domain-containing protein
VSSILAFLSWYIIVSLLGGLTFPLVYFLFPALADRGYSFSRVAGLLIWGYLFWILTSLGLTQNTLGGILFALVVLLALSAWALSNIKYRISDILSWLKSNLRLVIAVEVLFFLAFVFLAFLRAGNPELDGTERPMELMFINAILRSPTFPPHDSWLSGYAISYYYFGYVLTAMLARLSGLTGSIAHNLMTSLIFALAAIGAYGILYNLLSALHRPSPILNLQSSIENSESLNIEYRISNIDSPSSHSPFTIYYSPIFLSFFAPLFLLLVSNLEAFLEILHLRSVFWPSGSTSNFWTWLGVKELSDPPTPLPDALWPRLVFWWDQLHFSGLGVWFNEQFAPSRFWWWWRASRVITDFDLKGNFQEVIDEFPFFSFLLGDLHPHVLAIPFNLLAIAVALNLFLGGWRGRIEFFGFRLELSKTGFLFSALVLGGLAFLNTWDILVGAALIVLAYVLFRVREDGWSWSRLEDVFVLGIPLGLVAIILYLPFYFGFSSQASGVLPNIINPTRGAQLWVMFAPFFIPIFAYLATLLFKEKWLARWRLAVLLSVGFVLLLWGFSWLYAWLVNYSDPALASQLLQSQGLSSFQALFAAASLRRLSTLGGLLTLLALLAAALSFLLSNPQSSITNRPQSTVHSQSPIPDSPIPNPSSFILPPSSFIFLLILLASLLVIAPEFVYLHDGFGTRMNTIFKFYYQAWLLWSLAAAFATAFLLQNLRRVWDWVFRIGLILLLFVSLAYPVFGVANKTNNFNPPLGWTLDDFTRIQRSDPDEADAIRWLQSAPDGVIAEAVGGGYTSFGRISVYTGLPTVINWPDHESQWGRTGADLGTRQDDIKTLYSTSNWSAALAIIQQYNIQYIYVGSLERSTYPVQEEKFQAHLTQVFHQGIVAIYAVH